MRRLKTTGFMIRLMILLLIVPGTFGGGATTYADTLPGPSLAQIAGHDFSYGAYVGAPYYIGYQTGGTREYNAFVSFNKTANAPSGYKVYLRIKVGKDYGTGSEDLAIRGTPIAKVWAYKTTPLPSSVDMVHTGWPSIDQVKSTPSTFELLDSHLGTILPEQLLSFDVTQYFNSSPNGKLTFFLTGNEGLTEGVQVERFRFDEEPYLEYEQVNNTPPTVPNYTPSTVEDVQTSGTVVGSDVDGDTLTYSVSQQAANGVATVNSTTGEWEYTPNADYHGQDEFKIEVSDGKGGTATSTITVTVTPVNDAPMTSDDTATTNKNKSVTGQVSASDVDGDTLTYSVSQQAAHGTATVNASTGAWEYTPDTNYYGQDTFKIGVADGNGGTATSTVTVTVVYVNDAPVTSDDTATTDEDTSVTGQVSASDKDGDTLTYSVSQQAANGGATVNSTTGEWEYTPNADYHGQDEFKIEVSDGKGGTATSTITVTVTPVNDAPMTSDDTATTNKNKSVTGQVSASDVDGDTLTYSVSQQAAHGTATVNALTGAWEYTPDTNYYGQDTFKIGVADGNGGTATSTVTVAVVYVNDAPVTSDDTATTDEDTSVTGQVSASDKDGDTLTYSVSQQASNGVATVSSTTGGWEYTPNTDYHGQDVFKIEVSDGKGGTATSTITVTVTPVNDVPITSDDTVNTSQNTSQTGQVSASDVDGDILTYSVSQQAAHGMATVNATTGAWEYTPDTDYYGQDVFKIEVSDGKGGTATSTIAVAVTRVNKAPTLTGASSIPFQIFDTQTALPFADIVIADADEDNLTVTITADDSVVGEFTADSLLAAGFNRTGSAYQAKGAPNELTAGIRQLVFKPVSNRVVPGATETAVLKISVTDDEAAPVVNDQTTIVITSVNDRPVAESASYNVTSFGTLTQKLKATDADVDGDNLTYRILTTGTKSVSLDVSGNEFVYVPRPGELGEDSFTYVASDGQEDSDPAVITVTILPSGIAELSALSTSTGGLTPIFDKDTLEYEETVAYSVTSVTVTAAVYDPNSTVNINGQLGLSATISDLAEGVNEIGVVVTPANASDPAKTYTIRLYRTEKPRLSGLTPSAGTLSPSFAPSMTDYRIQVPYGTNEIRITPIGGGGIAGISVNGNVVLSGQESDAIALQVGANTITIVARSSDGFSDTTYTLTVTRATQQTSLPDSSGSSGATNSSSATSGSTGASESAASNSGIAVYVDGVLLEQLAEVKKSASGNTIIALSNDKIIQKLNKESSRKVMIPYLEAGTLVSTELNGNLVQTMAEKSAVLEIQTALGIYTLPAEQIRIGEIAKQFGASVSPEEILIRIDISATDASQAKLVYANEADGGLRIVAPPVDFTIVASYGDKQVAVNAFDGYVERAIAIPGGMTPSRITTGVVLDSKGNVAHVPTRVTKQGDNYYAVISSLTNSTYSVIWNPRTMEDVKGHWSEKDVNDLTSRLVIEGTSATRFSPNLPITRAEFAAIVVRGLGLHATAGNTSYNGTFSDVSAGDWYAESAETAAAYGLITGYENGAFGAQRTITREEAIAILARAMQLTQLDVSARPEALSAFADQSDIGGWARDAISAAVRNGLVEGSFGQLRPKAEVTRAEAAALIRRLLQQADLIDK